jgi:GNAT superfamily N-acetyltransferase
MIYTLPSGLELDVTISPATQLTQKLRDFITGGWSKSGARFCVPYASGKALLDRARNLSKRSAHVLQNPSTYVALANFVGAGEDDVPIGWFVVAPNMLHFAYTRRPYRCLGVATLLLEELSKAHARGDSVCPFPKAGWIPCTHWTIRLPVEGFLFNMDRVYFYCGFEPLTYVEHHGPRISNLP